MAGTENRNAERRKRPRRVIAALDTQSTQEHDRFGCFRIAWDDQAMLLLPYCLIVIVSPCGIGVKIAPDE